MSIDFNIFCNRKTRFSREEFEHYSEAFGIRLEFHPDCDILLRKGVVPARLGTALFSADGEEKEYLVSFEAYANEYEHTKIETPHPGGSAKKSFFGRLFGRRKNRMPGADEETPFDLAVKNCDRNIFITCGTDDPVGVLSALILGAYFCDKCGAVFENPQCGRFFTNSDELNNEITTFIAEIKLIAANGQLETVGFTEWGELPSERPVFRS